MALRTVLIFVGLTVIGCNGSPHESISESALSRIVILLSDGRCAQALDKCDELLADDPTNYRALVLRGEICETLGQSAGATTAYKKAFLLRPLDSEAKSHLMRLRKSVVGEDESQHQNDGMTLARHQSTADAASDTSFSNIVDDDKAYRSPPSSEVPQADDSRLGAVSNPSHLQRLLRALALGQKKDHAAEQPTEIDGQIDRAPEWEELPMDESPPSQIVRFDLGLGLDIDTSTVQPRIPTTGQRRSFCSRTIAPVGRYGLFAGQATPPGRSPCRRSASTSTPAGLLRSQTTSGYELQPICGDGRDNNGNGLKDEADPLCWQDGLDPKTYSKFLDEGRAFLPNTSSLTPTVPPGPILAPTISPNVAVPAPDSAP